MTKPSKNNPTAAGGLSAAWVIFAQTLAVVLAKLKDDDYLCLTVQDSERYVRFSLEYDFGMRVETSSNILLDEDEQLTPQQIVSLIASGWNPPNWAPDDPILNEDDECPNYFLDLNSPVSFHVVANLTVRPSLKYSVLPALKNWCTSPLMVMRCQLSSPSLGLRWKNLVLTVIQKPLHRCYWNTQRDYGL